MRILYIISIYFIIIITACGQIRNAKERYESMLNLKLPDYITNFSSHASDTVFSKAYFSYNANEEYISLLVQHSNFAEESFLNKQIRKVSCEGEEFIQDFSYWTTEPITFIGRSCYSGTLFPYKHYIVYEKATGFINHFITQIRD